MFDEKKIEVEYLHDSLVTDFKICKAWCPSNGSTCAERDMQRTALRRLFTGHKKFHRTDKKWWTSLLIASGEQIYWLSV